MPVLCRVLLCACVAASTIAIATADVSGRSSTRASLAVGVQTLGHTFDPAQALGNIDFPVTNNVFDQLVRYDYSASADRTRYTIVPGLATSWRIIDDYTTEFSLRPGVRFHDGARLTAADVKFTFDRLLDKGSLYVSARNLLDVIARVDIVDDLTVRFVTRQPTPILLDLLGYHASAIVPKAYFEQVGAAVFGQHPIGTGPYRFDSLKPDESVRLVAFDDYFGGPPPATGVTIRSIPEVSARVIALLTGEVDLINSLTPDQLGVIEKAGCCRIDSVLTNHHILLFNTSHPALKDVRLRQALSLAIDRDALTRTIWHGSASVPDDGQYSAWGDELFDALRRRIVFNPERARRLVRESGYRGETIYYNTHPAYYANGLAVAVAIVRMWRSVGLDAEVRVNENWGAMPVSDPLNMVTNSSDWQIPADPSITLGMTWLGRLWRDDEAFRQLNQRLATTRQVDERARIVRDMLDLFDAAAPGAYLYRAPDLYAMRRGLAWKATTEYSMDFRAGSLGPVLPPVAPRDASEASAPRRVTLIVLGGLALVTVFAIRRYRARPDHPRKDDALPVDESGEPNRDVCLRIRNLSVHYGHGTRARHAVRSVSLDLARGEVLCLVGESGSGKSSIGHAILRLIGRSAGHMTADSLEYDGRDLARMSTAELSTVRGARIGLIFQEAASALNPTLTISEQLVEPIQRHRHVGRAEARAIATDLLRDMGLADPRDCLRRYPHELSGGMRQRAVIAIALCGEPDLVIADEPTTALDATVQAQILGMLKERQRMKGTSILFITHDLGVVADVADRVVVLRDGEIVEEGTVMDVFDHPCSGYTRDLVAAHLSMTPASERPPA